MRKQAVRIVNARRVEFSLQSEVTWLGADVGEEEGTVASVLGNECRITHIWVDVQGSMRVFSVYFWHSGGWTPRQF